MNTQDFKILLIEADLAFALELEQTILSIGYSSIARADNLTDALKRIIQNTPDLILMDNFKPENPLEKEICRKIKQLEIPIVIITDFANEKFYCEAQEYNMYGYLIKPINKYTLSSCLDVAIKKDNIKSIKKEDTSSLKVEEQEQDAFLKEFIFIKTNQTYHRISIADIQHIEAAGNYSVVYHKNGRTTSHLNLSQMEKLLPSIHFVKVHRSFLINLYYLVSLNVEENAITMQNKAVLPISRTNKKKLIEKITAQY